MNSTHSMKRAVNNDEKDFAWQRGKDHSNIIIENRNLNTQVLRYDIVLPDGKVLYDTIAIKEPPTNSLVIIRNQIGDIGLIKEWRPIPAKWFWACIRGFGEPNDEDNLATAKREAIEEIGSCMIIESKNIGILYQNTTFYENPVGIVLLSVEESKEENELESGIVEFRFFKKEEIKRMIGNGEINDVFTMSALARYLATESAL